MLCSLLSLALFAVCGGNGALTYRGVDWSSVAVEEQSGINYKTINGTAEPLEEILKSNGVNIVRQRVWVNPSNGDYNLDYNLKLAQRAKAQGLAVYLDFHFSDTWADPGHQAIPSGWPTAIDDLSQELYNYTLSVSNQFQSAGIQPEIMSIGNEITSGLLWPTGKTPSWDNIARLLHSASSGIKESTLDPKPKIMIHIDNGWNWNTQQNFYQSVLKPGTFTTSDFDVMGVSYYPFYNSGATLSALQTSLTNMAKNWGKEIMVAETDWPTSCPRPAYAFPSDLTSIPFSADGQVTFMKELAGVLADVNNATGIFYWEPAWVDNAGLGSSCASDTMFAYPGIALSSLSVFASL